MFALFALLVGRLQLARGVSLVVRFHEQVKRRRLRMDNNPLDQLALQYRPPASAVIEQLLTARRKDHDEEPIQALEGILLDWYPGPGNPLLLDAYHHELSEDRDRISELRELWDQ